MQQNLVKNIRKETIKKVRLTEEEINKIVDAFHGRKTIPQFSVVVPYDKMISKISSLAAGQYFRCICRY